MSRLRDEKDSIEMRIHLKNIPGLATYRNLPFVENVLYSCGPKGLALESIQMLHPSRTENFLRGVRPWNAKGTNVSKRMPVPHVVIFLPRVVPYILYRHAFLFGTKLKFESLLQKCFFCTLNHF